MKSLEMAKKINGFKQKKQIQPRLYRVGGSVRDELLGKMKGKTIKSKDRDYCVTGLYQDDFELLFPEAKLVGQDFPVYLMEVDGETCQIALARTERKIGEGYKGFKIFTSADLKINDDLIRRDLTFNAIAVDVMTNEIIDPFNGFEDLKEGKIKAVSKAFSEDPLRVLRAARFSSQFGFDIEEGTRKMMNSLKNEMASLKPERVFEEFKKALSTKKPSMFFRSLRSADVLDVLFPEIQALIGVEQPEKHHPEGDAFEHTMQVVDAMAKLTESLEARFTALVHDFGKTVTPKEKLPKHHGHEEAGVPIVEKFCDRMGLPKSWKRAAIFGTAQHGKFRNVLDMREVKVVDLVIEASKNPLGTRGFALLGLADKRGKNDPDAKHPSFNFWLEISYEIFKVKANPELSVKQIATDKRIRQSKIIKEIKKEIKIKANEL